MKSYDYEKRAGVQDIDWDTFAMLSRRLAERLAEAGVDTVVGIARAGLLPATTVACGLRCEMFPVRVTRRVDDAVVHEHPVWKVGVTPDVRSRRVAVIDEIADTGETLALVANEVRARGAEQVVTAALVGHTWADPAPDVVGTVTDALVVFPWGREVLLDDTWVMHPEIADALRLQNED